MERPPTIEGEPEQLTHRRSRSSSRRPAPGLRLLLRRGDGAQAGAEVVEDEPRGRPGARPRDDAEAAPRGRRRRCPHAAPPRAASPSGRSSRSATPPPRAGRHRPGRGAPSPAREASVEPSTAPSASTTTAASTWEEISVRSARADAASTGQTILTACADRSPNHSRSSSPTGAPTSRR